jgi:hypothetical protein
MPLTKFQREQRRLVFLRKYRQQLINLGLPEKWANAAFRIWKRGVRTLKEQLILDHVDEILAMPKQQRSAA